MPEHDQARLYGRSAALTGWLTGPQPAPIRATVADWQTADWAAARWAAQIHGVAPLLDHAAAHWPEAAALDPLLRTYCAAQRQLSAARVALLLAELREILHACAAEQLPVMPLKGALLATRYYPEPGLRPMNDLDLLVRPADEPRAIGLLQTLGYWVKARGWKHLTLARPAADGPLVSTDGEHPANPRALDLHVRLAERFWGIRYDLTENAWAESDRDGLLDAPAQIMRPPLLLHHLLIHASSDALARRLRLLHLHDIALVAAALDAAGWSGIVAGAVRRREQRLVYPALALARRYYPQIPPEPLAALRPGVPAALLDTLDASPLEALSFCNAAPTTPAQKLVWFQPGAEQLGALRHMLLPDPDELAHWYPQLARPALLPLAYARYGAELAGWAARRALGRRRRSPGS